MSPRDKPLAWLHGQVRTPPFSAAARLEAGHLLRLLQKGHALSQTAQTPQEIIAACRARLREYDDA